MLLRCQCFVPAGILKCSSTRQLSLMTLDLLGMQDLQEKIAVWSIIFYGALEYLLSYAAAGQHFKLTAIERGAHTRPMALSRSFEIK